VGLIQFFKENHQALHKIVKTFEPQFQEVLKKDGVQGLVEYANQYVDAMVEAEKLSEKISCGSGCSHCCYSEISVCSFEAMYIKSVVEYFNIPIDKNLLKIQNKKGFHKLKYADKKCVLLDDEGNCKIYEYRPLTCRLHNSTQSPKLCDFKDGVRTVETVRILEGFAIQILIYEMSKSKEYALHKILA